MPTKDKEIVIILDNIRSAENVGSIFRTADAAGVSKIYCAGYTPAPIDRFGRKQGRVAKAALGAEKTVEWEQVEDAKEVIQNLKKEGFFVIAVEQAKKSLYYKNIPAHAKTCLIFGNEVDGISSEILLESDSIAEIPMYGEKESLNVSVAVGIALYSLR